MNETDQSIPLDQIQTDTLPDEFAADTSNFEPAAMSGQPENNLSEADVTETENNGLIFGKFKSMEEAQKSYKEAERAITRAALLEKELQQYQQLSEQYEQDALARDKGYSDRLDLALDHDLKQHELDNYAMAAKYTLPPAQQLKVLKMIDQCRVNCSKDDFSKIRSFFSPEVAALAAEDAVLFKNARQSEYDVLRAQNKQIRHHRKLAQFRNKFGDWSDSPLKEELLAQAMEVTDGNIDLFKMKDFIDAVETEAIRKFQAGNAARRQNAEIQNSLLEPANTNTRNKNKKWLTRDEYYDLTPEQEAEKYDLIVEQILLEKQGLLPPQLTK